MLRPSDPPTPPPRRAAAAARAPAPALWPRRPLATIALVLATAPPLQAQPASAAPAPATSVAAPASAAAAMPPAPPASSAALGRTGAYPPAPWLRVPRIHERLRAAELGLVVNTADPYSVAVGEYYAARRGLGPAQILYVELPLRDELTAFEFEDLRGRIERHFGADIQAVAMAWNAPYAVGCNSITAALTLGLDAGLCSRTCAPGTVSPYFRSPTARPRQDLNMRLSMLLAAGSVEQARALIDRGVASDGTLGLRGAPPVQVLLTTSEDRPRNVRAALYPAPAQRVGVRVAVVPVGELAAHERIAIVQAGVARVPQLQALQLLPGAVADHLTSFGGALNGRHGQTTALDWIRAGASASYGTVSEPCNHLQKFPHPQLLLLHYLQGATAIEAYWRSVAWPQQGLFVGEPLAAPFAHLR